MKYCRYVRLYTIRSKYILKAYAEHRSVSVRFFVEHKSFQFIVARHYSCPSSYVQYNRVKL